ncbi:MAG: hypothetical protein OdinLCB4_007355 [Candidatus Odinarchaeum yellowstonii]|uniref:Uncharacterized protein n=1 Tax=Odinarchaeota yellowstonii (strain LCB_4) TaxID=1841599 RepID=A0AAF0D230_ODILC|nr:MAG: hypothetical protein OdinLCB4_007355 [Candidatus Odinarchaeum yellowstonii]
MWVITLEKIDEKFKTIQLADCKKIFGSYTVLKPEFFDDLYRRVTGRRNYQSMQGVKQVTGEDGQDWSENSWYLILARDKKNLDFWLLVKQEPDGSGRITGVGPDQLTQYIKENRDFPFLETVEALIRAPGKWSKILVLVN